MGHRQVDRQGYRARTGHRVAPVALQRRPLSADLGRRKGGHFEIPKFRANMKLIFFFNFLIARNPSPENIPNDQMPKSGRKFEFALAWPALV